MNASEFNNQIKKTCNEALLPDNKISVELMIGILEVHQQMLMEIIKLRVSTQAQPAILKASTIPSAGHSRHD